MDGDCRSNVVAAYVLYNLRLKYDTKHVLPEQDDAVKDSEAALGVEMSLQDLKVRMIDDHIHSPHEWPEDRSPCLADNDINFIPSLVTNMSSALSDTLNRLAE